jgi:hypothetical protein
MSKKNFFVYILVIILMAYISSCTLSASKITVEPPEDAIYTAAAETIIAQYTQDADLFPESDSTLITPDLETDAEINTTNENIQEPILTLTGTPTPTHEPTPTMTVSSTPILEEKPEPLWEDDFSNQSIWYVDDSDGYGFKYEEGGYVIYNNLLNASIWSLGYLGLSDVRVGIDAKRIDGPEDSYYGVFCRHSNEGLDYYGLVIGDDGFYGIMKMVNGDLEFIETGFDENNIIHQGKGEINHIEGNCFGNKLSLSVNDQLILELEDNTHADGGIGILAANKLSGVGVGVLFDNFVIYDE